MGKLFGTDGIRGIVGENLTVELAFHVGQAVAAVLTEEKGSKPTITIGKDTRISSDMLEAALMAGICSVGGDVMPLGTIPTPAVAYLTVLEQADAGIVIYHQNSVHSPPRQIWPDPRKSTQSRPFFFHFNIIQLICQPLTAPATTPSMIYFWHAR